MAKGGTAHKFNPEHVKPTGGIIFGSYGDYPTTPCKSCGWEFFYVLDWNMGYYCENCDKVWK